MTYLVDVSGKYREVNVAKKNEFMCSYATLPEVKSSKQMGVCGTAKSPPCTPDHFDIPKVPQCRAVTLYPKESALIFIKNYFSFQGDDGVLVDGKSYEITE